MKISKEFVLRKIGEETVVVPVGDNLFSGVLKLNDTGAFIWNCAVEGNENQTIAEKMTELYDVTFEKAMRDVLKFEEKMRQNGICD